ncbi:hypothetical protein CBR_g51819 [Chara braunii]|uniref:Protein kinase domain-containing protein n=1 Tax=Chara braunii TaxID=69332 RepID=A0A388M990_CHABU|nr:hypothetical protein CBR_g51819 [Chara braunii]|eukprot:GBG91085.1 hypothetical protein CBR_g51819 [Chara braunii]
MDVTSSGSHLVVSTGADALATSSVALLSTSDDSRVSIPTTEHWLASLAFNPNRSRVYTVGVSSNYFQLYSAAMVEEADAVPLGGESVFEVVASIPKHGIPDVGAIVSGPQSLDPEGNCLYFVNDDILRLWGIDLSSLSKTPTFVAGAGGLGVEDGAASMASFYDPKAVAVTPDGCNLLVAQRNGYLRLIRLGTPCGPTLSVQTVAAYDTIGLYGLALRANGASLHVYLGSTDEHVFELEIDQLLMNTSSREMMASPSSSSQPPPVLDPGVPSSDSPGSDDLVNVVISPVSFPSSLSLPASDPSIVLSSSQVAPTAPLVKASKRDPVQPVVLIVVPVLSAAAVGVIACALFLNFRSHCCRLKEPPGGGKGCASIEVPMNSGGGSSVERPTETTVLSYSKDGCLCPEGDVQLPDVTEFTLAELCECTGDIHSRNIIGRAGAFGTVYRGKLGNQEVAVKIMHG